MAGAAPLPEHQVRCLPPLTKSGGNVVLQFDLDGNTHGVSLRVGHLTEQLVADLPDRALDLLEIAAIVYAVDSVVSRGGLVLDQMGKKWHRQFNVEMPVRESDFWANPDVVQALEQLLMFLGGDGYSFNFVTRDFPDAERSGFFRFRGRSAWRPHRVLMFSGGLDSFAGALEEIIEQKQRVALISHFSATKIAPIQRGLYSNIAGQLGADVANHFRVQIQMVGRKVSEGTHRSRSFLFAALGAILAQAFGLDRLSFHENGVVSLNLPPVSNVLGTRATRTTHPRTLELMTGFLGRVFETGMRVDNPYFWRTKTDVVSKIAHLGIANQIRHTRSCADVHNQSKQHVHCGRCSQCVDRRFAVLAAGLEAEDPEEAYRVDLMTGRRQRVEDREMALSYVRNAGLYEQLTPALLMKHFPDVLNAVDSLGEPPTTALARIAELLKRHGASVQGVVREWQKNGKLNHLPDDSLPRLYGEEHRDRLFGAGVPSVPPGSLAAQDKIVLQIDQNRNRMSFDGAVEIREGATFGILLKLAKEHLNAASKGLDPFDYPAVSANHLAKRLALESDAVVRQRVKRTRSELGKKFASAELAEEDGRAIIENVPGHGYRLAPDRIEVRLTGLKTTSR